jgi:acetylornithine/succinyldiaminopimelate/putrescine aminotransferase
MLFHDVRLSLADLVGEEFVDAAAEARAELLGIPAGPLRRLGKRKIRFFPPGTQRALAERLPRVGQKIVRPARVDTPRGATTRTFRQASHLSRAPLTAWGYYRVGEDGALRFTLKSEHYHAPLGHDFAGYDLVDIASVLGIPNATHNNTRGAITRRLEEELVRTANGLEAGDAAGLTRQIAAERGGKLNRVLNLETGSVACEAGIKLMLARFFRIQPDSAKPKYAGRVPVLVVIGDKDGGPTANYHGTTVLAQFLRGMWPEMAATAERAGLLRVVSVRPENFDELEAVFRDNDKGPRKIAGLLHELVLMNYGARRLSERFVRRMYALCRRGDVPVLCDEIQTGLWSPELFMFREYGVRPNMVALGKGFPGGEYPASKLLFDASLDCLPQFGALVTNGQEELASLAYLVTMRWALANADITAKIGERYEASLRDLAVKHASILSGIQGRRHLSALCFHDLAVAKALAARLVEGGLDISVQTYKQSVPPAALTKLPLIAGEEAAEFVLRRMDEALTAQKPEIRNTSVRTPVGAKSETRRESQNDNRQEIARH